MFGSLFFVHPDGTVRTHVLADAAGYTSVVRLYRGRTVNSQNIAPVDTINRTFFNAKPATFTEPGEQGPKAFFQFQCPAFKLQCQILNPPF